MRTTTIPPRFGGEAAKSRRDGGYAAEYPGAAAHSLALATFAPGYRMSSLRDYTVPGKKCQFWPVFAYRFIKNCDFSVKIVNKSAASLGFSPMHDGLEFVSELA